MYLKPYNNIILFDGVCNLCNESVKFIIKKDKKAHFKFTSLQSEMGQTLIKSCQNDLDSTKQQSVILIKNNKAYTHSTAALLIAKHLSFPWNLLYAGILIPKFIRDGIYNIIAKNRYKWFGKVSDACLLPNKEFNSRFL